MGARVRVGTNGVSASTSVSGQGCTGCISLLILLGVIGAAVKALEQYWFWFALGGLVIAVTITVAGVSNRKKPPAS